MADRRCTLTTSTDVDHEGVPHPRIVAVVTELRPVVIGSGRFFRPDEAEQFARQMGAEIVENGDG